MKQITLAHITQQLVVTQARIKCADIINDNDADTLMKVLVELKEYEMAIHVAREYHL